MLEGIGGRRKRDNRGRDGWMASLTRWTWVWVNSGNWWWTGRSGVLRFMGSQRVGHNWVTELNWDSKTTHRPAGECFLVFGNFSFKTPFPGWIFVSTSFVCLFIFYILSYLLFKDNGLPFWASHVLCQHSEVVLWNFLRVQIFFRWICGEESGLLILFLRHLRTAPVLHILLCLILLIWGENL